MEAAVAAEYRADEVSAGAAHSPLPWRVMDPEPDRKHGLGACDGICDANGRRVIETDSGYYAPCLPDAYLIVTAVNSHADVLTALKAARVYVAVRVEGVPADEVLIEDAATLHGIDAAIAKAEAR